MRELDGWIDDRLFDGGKYVGLVKRGLWYRPDAHGYTGDESEAGRWLIGDAIKLTDPNADEPVTVKTLPIRHYSTDPAAAMGVWWRRSVFCRAFQKARQIISGNCTPRQGLKHIVPQPSNWPSRYSPRKSTPTHEMPM
jgi:hypothetical protein